MPARSIAQQRLMAQAYALKRGDLNLSDIDPEYRDEIRDLSQNMTTKQLRDFAATAHKGLPNKVEKTSEDTMVTPANINGIGPLTMPDSPGGSYSFANSRPGSGDIPSSGIRKKTKTKMKHVKLFEEFVAYVNEGRRNPLVESILDALENTILRMLNEIEDAYIKKEVKFTQYERELHRLELILDMLRSIEIYTQPTDVLISITPSSSSKGNIQISAKIQRENKVYSLMTDVILAGGYNIQRLHYRYITKTNLPKTGNNELTTAYTDKIKKLRGAEKINSEISQIEKNIEKIDDYLASTNNITDEQIVEIIKKENPSGFKMSFEPATWEEIVRRGADKNFDYDRDKYDKNIKEYQQYLIDSWKTMRASKVGYRKTLVSSIDKLKKKLENFL